MDVLQKLKDQVRILASRVSQLDSYLNLVKIPAEPSTPQEMLKVKQNIINNITHLLKETKPLGKIILSYLCTIYFLVLIIIILLCFLQNTLLFSLCVQ